MCCRGSMRITQFCTHAILSSGLFCNPCNGSCAILGRANRPECATLATAAARRGDMDAARADCRCFFCAGDGGGNSDSMEDDDDDDDTSEDDRGLARVDEGRSAARLLAVDASEDAVDEEDEDEADRGDARNCILPDLSSACSVWSLSRSCPRVRRALCFLATDSGFSADATRSSAMLLLLLRPSPGSSAVSGGSADFLRATREKKRLMPFIPTVPYRRCRLLDTPTACWF